jgi:hypothetical protein
MAARLERLDHAAIMRAKFTVDRVSSSGAEVPFRRLPDVGSYDPLRGERDSVDSGAPTVVVPLRWWKADAIRRRCRGLMDRRSGASMGCL